MGFIINSFLFDSTPTPDFEDDFSSNTGWTAVGSGVTVDNASYPDMIKANAINTATDNRVHKALGFTLGDDFVARFVVNSTSISGGAFVFIFALTAGTSNLATSTNMDLISVAIDMGSYTVYMRSKDGTTAGTNTAGFGTTAGTTYYIEVIKDGTAGTIKIRTGSFEGTPTTKTTTFQTISGLTHVQTGSMSGGNAGTATYQLNPSIQIWNNVTEV